MPTQLLFTLLLMAVFGGYSIYVIRKRKAGMGPAFQTFFERTGYRYADIPDAPMPQQIAYGEEVMKKASRGYETHMVRDFHGIPVHWISASRQTDQGWSISSSWFVPLGKTPMTLVQIAEKSLSGVGKAVKEMFSNTERVWEAIYPVKVEPKDPDLAKRFHAFGESAEAVERVLAAPGLRELLLGCVEVDLVVTRSEVRFADPLQKNIRAAMGGMVGAMAMGTDLSRQMEMTIPIHDRVAELCATIARAAA